MGVDRPVPLASAQDMDQSTLRDLVRGLEPDEIDDLMMRATRSCESYCGGRRLAPFVGVTESHRADGVDPSELDGGHGLGDLGSISGRSYSRAAGGGSQVRRIWVDQRAPMFPEMWSYSDVTITIIRSSGSVDTIGDVELLGDGIEPDTGELWFRSGLHLPVGSRVRVRYSGGYHTVPLDLVNACRWMAAADVVDEDNFPGDSPGLNAHSDDSDDTGRGDGGFLARAHAALKPYR